MKIRSLISSTLLAAGLGFGMTAPAEAHDGLFPLWHHDHGHQRTWTHYYRDHDKRRFHDYGWKHHKRHHDRYDDQYAWRDHDNRDWDRHDRKHDRDRDRNRDRHDGHDRSRRH